MHVAHHGLEAAERIAALQPDLAFLDIQMPGLTGLEVAQGIEGDTRVVFVTAYDDCAVQAFEQEAIDYVLKPVNPERLKLTVDRLQRALAAPAAGQLRGQLRGQFGDARAGSPACPRRRPLRSPGRADLSRAASAAAHFDRLRGVGRSSGSAGTDDLMRLLRGYDADAADPDFAAPVIAARQR